MRFVLLWVFFVMSICFGSEREFKIDLTQAEYLEILQGMRQKGLAYCLSTFNDELYYDDKEISRDIFKFNGSIFFAKAFYEVFDDQYPELLKKKEGWMRGVSVVTDAIRYIQRYIEAKAPFMTDYEHSKFPSRIKEINIDDYLDSFFKNSHLISYQLHFPACFQIYDSAEYQEYLSKVINFIICKNCQDYKGYKAMEIHEYQTTLDELIAITKMQGFARCVKEYYPNQEREQLPSNISGARGLLWDYSKGYNDQIDAIRDIDHNIDEIVVYIQSIMDNKERKIYQSKIPPPFQGDRPIVLSDDREQPAAYISDCLEIYDSQEYHDKVRQIVKKYCKDCK